MEQEWDNWLIYPPRPAWCEVETDAIIHNTQQVCRMAHPAALMAVVKADGFGHGVVESARAALSGGASHLGVAVPEEGIALRKAGIYTPILILGTILPRLANIVVAYDMAVSLGTSELAEALDGAAASFGRPARVHLKVDTGLHRIGLPLSEALPFLQTMRQYPNVVVDGVFSTLADPDNPETSFSVNQYQQFSILIKQLEQYKLRPPTTHLTNSPLLKPHPEMNLDLVRVGRLLFGVTAWHPDLGEELDLRPALSIRCEVVFIQSVPKDDSIGFDRLVYARRKSRIATLPVGFADVGRFLHGDGRYVLLHGRPAPVSSVASDQTLVDVTDIPDVRLGDIAVLLGEQNGARIHLHEIMSKTRLSAGTLCTGLTRRLAKVYLRGGVAYRLQSYLNSDL